MVLGAAPTLYTPVVDYTISPLGNATPVFGTPQRVDGFRLVDARASYGIGLETFALGFPIHFDWAWRTLLNKPWEDLLFAASGGSSAFRKAQFCDVDRLRLLRRATRRETQSPI